MYNDSQRLQRSPITIKLDDLELSLRPLTDASISELDLWVRAQAITAASAAAKSLPADEGDRILKIAISEASTMSFVSGVGAKHIGTIDGMCQLLYQMAKQDHPSLTANKLRALMTKAPNVKAVNDAFELLNLTKTRGSKKTGKKQPPKSMHKRK